MWFFFSSVHSSMCLISSLFLYPFPSVPLEQMLSLTGLQFLDIFWILFFKMALHLLQFSERNLMTTCIFLLNHYFLGNRPLAEKRTFCWQSQVLCNIHIYLKLAVSVNMFCQCCINTTGYQLASWLRRKYLSNNLHIVPVQNLRTTSEQFLWRPLSEWAGT